MSRRKVETTSSSASRLVGGWVYVRYFYLILTSGLMWMQHSPCVSTVLVEAVIHWERVNWNTRRADSCCWLVDGINVSFCLQLMIILLTLNVAALMIVWTLPSMMSSPLSPPAHGRTSSHRLLPCLRRTVAGQCSNQFPCWVMMTHLWRRWRHSTTSGVWLYVMYSILTVLLTSASTSGAWPCTVLILHPPLLSD